MEILEYLDTLRVDLLHPSNWQKVIMTREWASKILSTPGVYVLKEGDDIVYVGETGDLKGRMTDLLDSRHHTVRRTIGERFYSSIDGFQMTTTKKKFPEHIERLVNEHICTRLDLAFIEVKLGRKELEEYVVNSITLVSRLNKRGKRKSR